MLRSQKVASSSRWARPRRVKLLAANMIRVSHAAALLTLTVPSILDPECGN